MNNKNKIILLLLVIFWKNTEAKFFVRNDIGYTGNGSTIEIVACNANNDNCYIFQSYPVNKQNKELAFAIGHNFFKKNASAIDVEIEYLIQNKDNSYKFKASEDIYPQSIQQIQIILTEQTKKIIFNGYYYFDTKKQILYKSKKHNTEFKVKKIDVFAILGLGVLKDSIKAGMVSSNGKINCNVYCSDTKTNLLPIFNIGTGLSFQITENSRILLSGIFTKNIPSQNDTIKSIMQIPVINNQKDFVNINKQKYKQYKISTTLRIEF